MQINWTIIAIIIPAITTISAPVLQVVFASWYTSRNTQPDPKPETSRAMGRNRTKRFLSVLGMPVVLLVVNVWALISDFRTIHPPLVVRDIFFVASHVAGLTLALVIALGAATFELIGRMLDVQGRLADSHIRTTNWLASEVDKKADSRRQKK
jgi:hypothetical protein